MSTPFTRNGILTVAHQSYCLVCNVFLCSENEIRFHIGDYYHKTLFRFAFNHSNFEAECVKKVHYHYFCEVCDKAMHCSASVRQHIAKESHKENLKKEAIRIKKKIDLIGEPVIVKDIIVPEEAWHSYVDGICLICDIEYKDYTLHRYSDEHIISMVNSKVCAEGDNLYRKLKDGYHCLTCNMFISNTPENVLQEHFETSQHKEAIDKRDPSEPIVKNYEEMMPNPFVFTNTPPEDINDNIPPLKILRPFRLEID